ncbi:MAG TPA: coproporphyrinogen-III oxidase family protein [Candidatus Paceibacterota bacterium]|nr:coproporphyrinogen-III oxidase family protein [Candidatus Paceibacterota bacterium]
MHHQLNIKKLPRSYLRNKNSGNYRYYIPPDLAVADIQNIRTDAADILTEYKNAKEISLYISIPFCKARCVYCNYFLYPYGKDSENFLDYTKTELSILDKKIGVFDKEIKSLYFGGGTPSIISIKNLDKFLSSITSKLSLAKDCETTLEASPEDGVENKFDVIKHYANRLSLGIESFYDANLKFLNRRYDGARAKEVIKLALKTFNHVNIDLLYALPKQTIEDWERTIKIAVSLGVDGISTYRTSAIGYGPLSTLIASHRTNAPLFFIYKKHPRLFPSEVAAIEMYLRAKELLEGAGYEEILIGFFIKPKIKEIKVYEQRWARSLPMYGIGLGAYSYAPFGFIHNQDEIENYIKDIKRGILPIRFSKKFGSKEALIFKLLGRLKSGQKYYEGEVDKNMLGFYKSLIKKQIECGFVEENGGVLNLTLLGRALVDRIAFDILEKAKTV